MKKENKLLLSIFLLLSLFFLGGKEVNAAKIYYYSGNENCTLKKATMDMFSTKSCGSKFKEYDLDNSTKSLKSVFDFTNDNDFKNNTDVNTLYASGYVDNGWKVYQNAVVGDKTTPFTLGSTNFDAYASINWVKTYSQIKVKRDYYNLLSTIATNKNEVTTVEVKDGDTVLGNLKINGYNISTDNGSVSFTVTPATNYRIKTLKYYVGSHDTDIIPVASTTVTGAYDATIENIETDIVIYIDFELDTKTIKVNDSTINDTEAKNVASKGSIKLDKFPVLNGVENKVTITPLDPYVIDEFKIGESDKKADLVAKEGSFETEFTITEDTNIVLTFTDKYLDVNTSVGSVEGSGTVTSSLAKVKYNNETLLTFTPSEGYEIDNIKVNNLPIELTELEENDGVFTYTLKNVKEVQNVVATYKLKRYEVTTTVIGGHGKVSSGGTFNHFDVFEMELMPDQGYMLEEISVNGVPANFAGSNIFRIEVTKALEIEVKYRKIDFELTIKANDNANIVPTGTVFVKYNESQEVTIQASEGYKIVAINVNGVDKKADLNNGVLTFKNDTPPYNEAKEVVVVVEKITYNITTKVNDGKGTITEGKVVDWGTDFTAKFEPAEGYMISYVKLDGEEVKITDLEYKLTNIKDNHTIEIAYTKIPVTLMVIGSDDAEIKPIGEVALFYGDSQEINIVAKPGFVITSVIKDGAETAINLKETKISVNNLKSDATIEIKVAKEEYKVLEGENQVFNPETKELNVRFSGDLELFVDLYINDELVDKANYTVESGSTIVKLNKNFMDTLKDGEYTLKALYSNGNSAEATFTVEGHIENPKTGDSVMAFAVISILSLAGIAGVSVLSNKKNKQN